MTGEIEKIIKNDFVSKDLKKELAEITKIVKSDESDEVKLDSIKAILSELAEEITIAKASALFESRTGLYSPQFGEDFLAKEIEKARREKYSFSIALIDIDYLKFINDNYGHVVGTKAILEVAEIIKSKVRKSDVVSRYGGDEFLIIFSGSHGATVDRAIERIQKEVSKIEINKKAKVSLSVGIATFDGSPKVDAERMIILADTDLYRSKKDRVNVNS